MSIEIKSLFVDSKGNAFSAEPTLPELLNASDKGISPVLVIGESSGFVFDSSLTGSAEQCDWSWSYAYADGSTLEGTDVIAYLRKICCNAGLSTLTANDLNGVGLSIPVVGNVAGRKVSVAGFIKAVASVIYGGNYFTPSLEPTSSDFIGSTPIPCASWPEYLEAETAEARVLPMAGTVATTYGDINVCMKHFLNWGNLGALHEVSPFITNYGKATLTPSLDAYDDSAEFSVAIIAVNPSTCEYYVMKKLPLLVSSLAQSISTTIESVPIRSEDGAFGLRFTIEENPLILATTFDHYCSAVGGNVVSLAYFYDEQVISVCPVGATPTITQGAASISIGDVQGTISTSGGDFVTVAVEGQILDYRVEDSTSRIDFVYPEQVAVGWDTKAWQNSRNGYFMHSSVKPNMRVTRTITVSWGLVDFNITFSPTATNVYNSGGISTIGDSNIAREIGRYLSTQSLYLFGAMSTSDEFIGVAMSYFKQHVVYDPDLEAEAAYSDEYVIGDLCTSLLGYISSGGQTWDTPYGVSEEEARSLVVTLPNSNTMTVQDIIDLKDGYEDAITVIESARFGAAYKLSMYEVIANYGALAIDAVKEVAQAVHDAVNSLYAQMTAALAAYRSPAIKQAIFSSYESDIKVLEAVSNDYSLAASLGISVEALEQRGLSSTSVYDNSEGVLLLREQLRAASGYITPTNTVDKSTFKALDSFWVKKVNNARSAFAGKSTADGEIADYGSGAPALSNPIFMAKVSLPTSIRAGMGLGELVVPLTSSYIRIVPTTTEAGMLVWYPRFNGNNDLDVTRCVAASMTELQEFVNSFSALYGADWSTPELTTIYDQQTDAFKEQTKDLAVTTAVTSLGLSIIKIGLSFSWTGMASAIIIGAGVAVTAVGIASSYVVATTDDTTYQNIANNKSVNVAKTMAYYGSDDFLNNTVLTLSGTKYTGDAAYAGAGQMLIEAIGSGIFAPFTKDDITPIGMIYTTPLFTPRYYFVEDGGADWSYWYVIAAAASAGMAVGWTIQSTKAFLGTRRIRMRRYWPGVIAGVLATGLGTVVSAAVGGITAAVSSTVSGISSISNWYNSGDESVDYDKITYDEVVALREQVAALKLNNGSVASIADRIIFF